MGSNMGSYLNGMWNLNFCGRYLDFIGLMSYDLNGAWDPTTGHNAPLHGRQAETGEKAYLNVVSVQFDRDKLFVDSIDYKFAIF